MWREGNVAAWQGWCRGVWRVEGIRRFVDIAGAAEADTARKGRKGRMSRGAGCCEQRVLLKLVVDRNEMRITLL